ncbi:MAG: class I SAM-dependent methyltransferase [Cephaloticoccus sp.]|nr:class I SAM-dependent methyltransferase [Cephaloticoccus sp.]MCF7759728.1 class I SAM-dependent methyltransferase [Cephaloticoccus sp.]
MDAAEYTNLQQVEEKHWYYAGKRELVRRWLQRVGPPKPAETLLDCGAGTGRFAREMVAHCRVLVLDDHEESLRLLREIFAADQVIALTGGEVPLPDASVDYITALDVLEHVEHDKEAVQGFHRLLKPGGIALVTVPAGMALWSDWDVSLHHFRRYSRPQLRAIFPGEQWEIIYLNYTNIPAFPIAWVLRRLRSKKPAEAGKSRMEDRIPAPWLNRILQGIFVRMAFWRLPFPFGLSLLLVARKR